MLLKGVFGHSTLPVLQKSLGAATHRQRVRANNIANVNTEGYQRREVRFEEKLRDALHSSKIRGSVSHENHIPLGVESVERVKAETYIHEEQGNLSGQNNVDVEYEMAELAKNQLLYQAAAKFANGNFSKLRSAIRGRAS